MMEWKDIQGFEGLYQVSNTGLVRSLDRMIGNRMYKGTMIKPFEYQGYKRVELYKHGDRYRYYIHVLVGTMFIRVGKHKEQINHIDFNRSNNNVSNLEWCTPIENVHHSIKAGRYKHIKQLTIHNTK